MLSSIPNILKNEKQLKFFFIACVVLLLPFRFVYLEQDTPSYYIGGIAQVDEVYYSLGSLTRYYNDIGQTVKGYDEDQIDGVSLYALPIQYWSYKLFGNTYYGLRVPVVLFSLLSILFMALAASKIIGNSNRWLFYLVVLMLMSDFSFFTFSRYFTPQLFSIFIISSFFLIFISKLNDKAKWALISFVAFCSVTIYYVYNIFLLGGVGMFLLIKSVQKRSLQPVLFGMFGVVIGFFFFSISLMLIGESLLEYVQIFISHNDTRNEVAMDLTIQETFVKLFYGFISVVNTNLFRYNPILLAGLVIGSLNSMFLLFSKRKISDIEMILLVTVIILLLQAGMVISYPFKKWIVILPIAFVATIVTIHKAICGEINGKVLLMGSLTSLLLYANNVRVNNSKEYWKANNLGALYENINEIYVFALILMLISFLLGIVLFVRKSSDKLLKLSLTYSVVIFLALSINTYIIDRKFEVKETLISFNEIIRNKPLIGGYSQAFSFYTESKPLYNGYSARVLGESYKEKMDEAYQKLGGYRIEKVNDGRCQISIGDELKIRKQIFKVRAERFVDYYCLYLLELDKVDND